jgi:hypothetical protein
LAVGQQTNAIKAGVTHTFDHLISRAGDHAFPVAGELEGRGKQGHSGLYGWGKLRHGCQESFSDKQTDEVLVGNGMCRGSLERTF